MLIAVVASVLMTEGAGIAVVYSFKTEINMAAAMVLVAVIVSELGNRLCKMHPEIDFVVMIDIDGCTVSYRTVKEDIDLGKDVASIFGGGGHPKAAGSEFSQSIKLKVIEEIFE